MHTIGWLKSLVHTSQPSRGGAPKAGMRTTVPARVRLPRQAKDTSMSVEQGKGERESYERQAQASLLQGRAGGLCGADKEAPSDLSRHSLEEVLC